MAHWVTHGNNHSTQTLHPTLGHALVLCKKDGYQSCFSCYHLTVMIHTHPSMSEQPYPSCSRTCTNNYTTITPGHQSLDAKPQQPWPQLTLTVIAPDGINTTQKKWFKIFACNTTWQYRYQPVYHHNFSVTWLTRLLISSEQFSSS